MTPIQASQTSGTEGGATAQHQSAPVDSSASLGRDDTATADPKMSALSLIWEAFYQQDQDLALRRLRQHAKRIRALLGKDEIRDAMAVKLSRSVSQARIAAVYLALAHVEPEQTLPVDTREALLQANLDEEAEIGWAFKEDLLHGLTPVLKNLIVYFAAAPRVSRKEQQHLRETASVGSAWPECAGLVACGLTPLAVFYATNNVTDLAERLLEHKQREPGPLVLSRVRGSNVWRNPLSEFSHRVAREVLQVNRCSEQAADTLVDWLIEVATIKSLVFAGYRAELDPAGVRLVAEEDYARKPLSERWGPNTPRRVERVAETEPVTPDSSVAGALTAVSAPH